jgi:hypothetical protein
MKSHNGNGYAFTLNSKIHEAGRHVTGSDIRQAGNITDDQLLMMKIEGRDEEISDNDSIDLAREEIESFYTIPKPVYPIRINTHPYQWPERLISGLQVRNLGNIPADEKLFLTIQGQDEEVGTEQQIDIARRGAEEFYSIRDKPREKVRLTIETTKGKWKDQEFPLTLTVAGLVQQVITKFHFAQDGNYQIKIKAGAVLAAGQTLGSYQLPDGTVLSFTDLGKGA